MKKTLITLVALSMASVVSAATLSDATHYDASTTTSLSSAFSASDGDYTATLVLDWDALSSSDLSTAYNDRNKLVEVSVATSTTGWQLPAWRTSMTVWKDGNTVKLGMYREDSYATFSSYDSSLGDQYNIDLTKDAYNVDGKLVLTYTFDSGVGTVYALKSDGSSLAAASTVYTGSGTSDGGTQWNPDRAFDTLTIGVPSIVEDYYVFDSALTAADVAAVSAAAVPEPATATLSLLALAGLAARRRRK